MSDAAYVEQACHWAKRLTHTEARGPGDIENAWRRLECRYAIPWRVFWALRYRRPKELSVHIYNQLAAAYYAERDRQMMRLRHEIEITKTVAGDTHPHVAQAEAVVGEDDGYDE